MVAGTGYVRSGFILRGGKHFQCMSPVFVVFDYDDRRFTMQWMVNFDSVQAFEEVRTAMSAKRNDNLWRRQVWL